MPTPKVPPNVRTDNTHFYKQFAHTKTAMEQNWKVHFQCWMDQKGQNMGNNFDPTNSE
jgi:hypothetical protein